MDIYEAIIFCVHAVLKKYYIMSGIHIHTLKKQLCLNYNSLGVSMYFHLAERVHDDIIYASSSVN